MSGTLTERNKLKLISWYLLPMIYGFGAILSLNPYFTWNTDALKLYSFFTLIVGLLYITVAIRLSFNVVFLLFNFFY